MQNSRSEAIKAGLARAAERGRRGGRAPKVSDAAIAESIPLGTVKGAAAVGLSVSSYIRRRRIIEGAAKPMTRNRTKEPA